MFHWLEIEVWARKEVENLEIFYINDIFNVK